MEQKTKSNINYDVKYGGINNMEYRYMIWNDLQKEYQFPSICETTEKGANTLLFKKIGNDARKCRFRVEKVEKDLAKRIVQRLKIQKKVKEIHSLLPNIDYSEIYNLVIKNEGEK